MKVKDVIAVLSSDYSPDDEIIVEWWSKVWAQEMFIDSELPPVTDAEWNDAVEVVEGGFDARWRREATEEIMDAVWNAQLNAGK